MKAIEQYFHVVLFIVLYKVVLTLESKDKTIVCDHSNESLYPVFFFCNNVCFSKSFLYGSEGIKGTSN